VPVDLTRRYIQLVDALGDQMGRKHGWRREVAEQLGVDPSTLSRILKGTRPVGWELAERAVEQLGIDRSYFSSNVQPASVLKRGSSESPEGERLLALVQKVEAGSAAVADVYELAREVQDSSPAKSARAILKTPPPKSEQEIGALFVAASRLIEQLRRQSSELKKAKNNT
jgi:transcriptional regulator with XRE-family HTH domain